MSLLLCFRPSSFTIKMNFREGESNNYYEKTKIAYKLQLKQALYYGNFATLNMIFGLGLTCGTLWYGGHLILTDRLNGENLIPFILYQLGLGDAIQVRQIS